MFRTIKPSGRTSSFCFIPFRLISFFVLVLAIILCTSKICSAQTSQNLLADPGFEEGGFVWQRVGSGWSSSTATEAYTGIESQEMVIFGGRTSVEVYQDVSVNGGSSSRAFGWVKTSEISGSVSIMIQWLDAEGNVISSDTITVSEDTQGWVQLSGNFIAPVATDIARFRLLTNEPDGSGTAWFDDLGLLVNQSPVLDLIGDTIINEGETVFLYPTATAPSGDALTFSYSGWMTSDTYTTNYLDVGVHTVTVTVSDGYLTDNQNVTVTVVAAAEAAATTAAAAETAAAAGTDTGVTGGGGDVVDTTAPSLTVPSDVTVEATGKETTVTIGTATATDES